MKEEGTVSVILKWIHNYVTFFILVAFVTTCCMMLFVTTLSNTLNLVLTEENINVAAKLTFLNVLLLSLIFATIDAIRRKLAVERPAKRITDAVKKIMEGDFSVRIGSEGTFGSVAPFHEIMEYFNKMAVELGSVETLRTDFIANVSHEMKTPLAVIQNYGTLLQATELSEEKRMEYAKGVTEGTRRMVNMMTNILKLSQLENQQIFPKTTKFDLGEQICECLLQYETVWEKEEIELEINIEEDIWIKADKELLFLVWNNLFSNAFKFTKSGGTVAVTLTATEQQVIVKVADTGCGMTPEIGAHIFEKFYQGDTSHTTQGNGLGLALVKRVIDIINGEITVESAIGVGSTFTVKIRRI